MKLERRIAMASLTPLEQKIGNYLLGHKEEALEFSIVDLAGRMYVSKSALHRFCKKVGFKGFNELKVKLAQELNTGANEQEIINVNYPFEQDATPDQIAYKLLELYRVSIKDTFDAIDTTKLAVVAKLLFEADVIDVYTHSHNTNAAENFQDKMLTIGRIVNVPKSFYKQRLNVLAQQKGSVALILSYSGKATFIGPLARLLNAKGIPVVLIGKINNNYFPQYIKYQLGISDQEDLRDRISQFSSHISLQYMLDVVFGCIYNLDRERNIKYLQNYIAYMDDRKI